MNLAMASLSIILATIGVQGVPTGEAPVEASRPGQPLPTDFVRDAGAPRMVWAAIEGDRPRSRPGAGAPSAAGSPALKFLEGFYYADEFVAPDRATYRLLARPKADGKSLGRLVGWVRSDGLINRAGAELSSGSNVARKVVIVDTTASLRRSRTGKIGDLATRRAPRPEASAGAAAKMLGVYFRYGEADGHVLIGASPTIDGATHTPEVAVLGWVPTSLTIPFDGRLAVEWDGPSTRPEASPRREAKGVIYLSREDAYATATVDARKLALFEEQADNQGASLPFLTASPRFPTLPYPDDDDRFPETDFKTGNQLLKVVAIGGFLEDNEVARNREQSQALREEIARITEQMGESLQILFVVDDTGSMGESFPEVANTVEAILKEARRSPDRTIEVAVSFYNDSKSEPPPPAPRTTPLADARANGSAIAQGLRRHVAGGGGEDLREDVFDGLIAAIDAANFKSRAQKMVVMIGDHGDKSDEKAAGHPREALIVDRLLQPEKSPILFAAVQVIDPDLNWTPEEAKQAAMAYRTQATTIISLLKEKGGPVDLPLGSYTTLKDVHGLTAALNKKFEDLRARDQLLAEKLKALQAREFHTKVGPLFLDRLFEREVPVEKLRELAGSRVGREGYVWRWAPGRAPSGGEPGTPQVRFGCLISEREIADLLARLAPLLTPPNEAEALAALRALPALQAGGSFEEKILRPLGLPANSGLLLRSPRNVAPSFARSEIKLIRNRAARLSARANRTEKDTGEAATEKSFRIGGLPDRWFWLNIDEELP